jgi:hypothetical protein
MNVQYTLTVQKHKLDQFKWLRNPGRFNSELLMN